MCKGDFFQAKSYYRQALTLRDDYTEAAEKLIAVLVAEKNYRNALSACSKLYKRTQMPKLLLARAALNLRLDNPLQALEVYQKARQYYPKSTLITAGQAKALSLIGHYEQADALYRWALKQNEPNAVLLRIENSIKAKNHDLSKKLLDNLVKPAPFYILLKTINGEQSAPAQIPFDRNLLKQAVLETAFRLTNNQDTSPGKY